MRNNFLKRNRLLCNIMATCRSVKSVTSAVTLVLQTLFLLWLVNMLRFVKKCWTKCTNETYYIPTAISATSFLELTVCALNIYCVLFSALRPVHPYVATSSYENEQNGSPVNANISFIARTVTQKRRRTSSTKRWKEHNVIVLLLSQL